MREAAEYLLDHIDKMGAAINELNEKMKMQEIKIELLRNALAEDELRCKNCGCENVQVDEICPMCGQLQRYF